MLNRYDEALEACEKALKLNSTYVDALKIKADISRKKGFYEVALEQYSRILDASNKELDRKLLYSNIWNNKGITLFHLKRHEEALKAYEEALELHLENAPAWNNKAIIQKNKKLYEEAVDTYEKALEIDPQLNIWPNIITALLDFFDNYNKSETSLNHTKINVLIKISCTCLMLNKIEEAKNYADQAYSSDKDNYFTTLARCMCFYTEG